MEDVVERDGDTNSDQDVSYHRERGEELQLSYHVHHYQEGQEQQHVDTDAHVGVGVVVHHLFHVLTHEHDVNATTSEKINHQEEVDQSPGKQKNILVYKK